MAQAPVGDPGHQAQIEFDVITAGRGSRPHASQYPSTPIRPAQNGQRVGCPRPALVTGGLVRTGLARLAQSRLAQSRLGWPALAPSLATDGASDVRHASQKLSSGPASRPHDARGGARHPRS